MKNGRNLEACEQGRQGNEQRSNPVCRASSLGEVGSPDAANGSIGGGQIEAAGGGCGKAGGQRARRERDHDGSSA